MNNGRNARNLLLAALTLALGGSCTSDVLTEEEGTQVAIGFSAVTNRLTRGDTKPEGTDYFLEDYHQTFAVYGTKKSQVDGEVSYVFGDNATALTETSKYDGVTCTFEEAGTQLVGQWTYAPARFWDTQADYRFIAYAPAAAPIRYVYGKAGDETAATGYRFLSTAPYTILGQNLQATPTREEQKVGFTGVGAGKDSDIMISDAQSVNGASHQRGSTVDLIFRHTLSKLNVKLDVETAEPALTDSVAGYRVEVSDVRIDSLYSQGSFDTGSWTVNDSTATSPLVSYVFATEKPGVKLDTEDTYFIESLVMPQDIAANQKVTLVYTITSIDENKNEHAEKYTYVTTLADIFAITATTPIATEFQENSNYTVSFHLNPENNVIQFDAGVAEWAQNLGNNTDID